jgi:hypothetical protein
MVWQEPVAARTLEGGPPGGQSLSFYYIGTQDISYIGTLNITTLLLGLPNGRG